MRKSAYSNYSLSATSHVASAMRTAIPSLIATTARLEVIAEAAILLQEVLAAVLMEPEA